MSKPNKPKAWDRKAAPTGYRDKQFEQIKRILIVCEGQTETLYFKSFDLNVVVDCIDSKGLTKLQLVEFCERKVAEYARKNIRFDETWCVFDMDVKHGKEQFSDFDNAIHAAGAKKYNVAYSNDAFELWFCLHYDFFNQQNLRYFYYEKLRKYWGFNYEKEGKTAENCKKIYDRLNNDPNASQEKAVQYARKLHVERQHLPCSQQNPVTTVYLLVTELNKYLKGVRRS